MYVFFYKLHSNHNRASIYKLHRHTGMQGVNGMWLIAGDGLLNISRTLPPCLFCLLQKSVLTKKCSAACRLIVSFADLIITRHMEYTAGHSILPDGQIWIAHSMGNCGQYICGHMIYMHTSSDLWIHCVIYDTSTFNWIFLQTAPHRPKHMLQSAALALA